MDFDAKLAVQVAVVTALSAAALPDDAAVWEHTPDDAEPPLVIVHKIALTPQAGKGGGLDLAEVEILTLVRKPGREFLTPLMASVRGRIEGQPLAADGATLSQPVFVSDDDTLLDDGNTYLGTQRFSLFVQPA
jgi:hypothetical protein